MLPLTHPTTAPVIQQTLAELSRTRGAQAAILADDYCLTFTELWYRATRAAWTLGPRPAQVVPIPAGSTAAFFVEVFAAWLSGGIPMPLDPKMPAQLREAMIRKAATGGPHTCRPWKATVSVAGGTYRPLFTGGEPPTVGRKAHALGLGPVPSGAPGGDVALFSSPMHLNGPFEFAVRHLLLGGAVALLSRFDPHTWATTAAKTRPGWAFLVPIQIARLLDNVEQALLEAAIGGLRTLLHSSAPCPTEVRDRLLSLVDAAVVADYYGAAEYDGTVTRGGWTGQGSSPVPGAQLRVIGTDGMPVPPGMPGVIEGRSRAGLGNHYAGERCATSLTWRTVGDHGHLDAEGRLTITGVSTEGRAIVGGINVALHRVHAVMMSHPAVASCQVVPVPDPEYGQRVTVRVTTGRALQPGTLERYCEQRLRPAERPHHIHVTSADPALGSAADEESLHAAAV
jgi:acyl-CoA synthetase (AMP-forming)/AMP-acid ligase II